MYKLSKMYALLLFIFFFSSCEKIDVTVPELVCNKGITNHPNAAKYQNLINKLLEIGITGVSMTVITPEGIWSQGGGKADLKNNINMTPCHTLRVGSVSKLFCATTILKLQDEGKLDINDKANKYIPREISDKVPNGNEVTIKQLLSHTAGIPEYSDMNSVLGILNLSIVKYSAEQNLKTIYGKKADFEPGTYIGYSNSNFLMLALVIKYITGKNANDVVNEKIVQPLGLINIFMSTTTPSSLSRSYIDTHDNGKVTDCTEIDNNAVGGEDMLDGGVIANSYDLAIFFNALVKGQILSDKSLAQMETFIDIIEPLSDWLGHVKQYGLGLTKLETDQGVAIGHYGVVYGFNALVYYFPVQNVTVAIIRNSDSAKAKKFFESKELFNYLF